MRMVSEVGLTSSVAINTLSSLGICGQHVCSSRAHVRRSEIVICLVCERGIVARALHELTHRSYCRTSTGHHMLLKGYVIVARVEAEGGSYAELTCNRSSR